MQAKSFGPDPGDRLGVRWSVIIVSTCLATASASTMDGPAETHYMPGAPGLLGDTWTAL
jgi:hypothetical protein